MNSVGVRSRHANPRSRSPYLSVVPASAASAGMPAPARFGGGAAGGEFGARRRIRLHIVGIVTQLADGSAQLRGRGLRGIVSDCEFGGSYIIRAAFHAHPLRDIVHHPFFTLLANPVGLNRNCLIIFGLHFLLRFLLRTERESGNQQNQNKK